VNTSTAVIAGLMLNLGLGGVVLAQSGPYGPVTRRYAVAGSRWQAEQMVRQAYLDILGREPDPSGMQQYTRAMLQKGWSEADVRRSLLSSPEYAQRRGALRYGLSRSGYGIGYGVNSQAAAIVQRAYLNVLGREPDAVGMRDYTTRIVRDGWSERDVVRSLRASDEYRYRVR
jgi:uncharacterized protein DUF4214